MNKNLKIALFSFLALSLVTATGVSAYQGPSNSDQANLNKAKNFNNYKNRTERMTEFHANMSEEDLVKISQMHELMKNGEYEKALEIKDDLGIKQGIRRGMGQKHGNRTNDIKPNFVDANNNGLCDHAENIEIN